MDLIIYECLNVQELYVNTKSNNGLARSGIYIPILKKYSVINRIRIAYSFAVICFAALRISFAILLLCDSV